MNYSQDKLDLLPIFTKMLNDPNQDTWRIQGPPGCGKTTFIKLLVNHYLAVNKMQTIIDPTTEQRTSSNIFLTATTNKAVSVINEEVTQPLASEHGLITTKTIYKLLELKVFNDFRTGATRVSRPQTAQSPIFPKNSLIIIDEASYIDWRMWKFITTDLLGLGLKVIFIGDFYQSVPVGSNMSPIFDPAIPSSALTERHRYPVGSAIHTNSLLCEKAIDTGKGGKLAFDDTLVKVTSAELPALIQEHFIDNQHNARIVAYTNLVVMNYNQEIGQKLYGNDFFNKDQQVIFNDFYIFGRVTVPNESLATVVNVQKPFLHGEYGIECARVTVDLNTTKQRLVVIVPVSYKQFRELLNDCASGKNWKKYFELKEDIVDLRPSWAVTSHKSQGSTYDYTIVDFNDLKTINVLSNFYRMFNVAITRSRIKTYIVKD